MQGTSKQAASMLTYEVVAEKAVVQSVSVIRLQKVLDRRIAHFLRSRVKQVRIHGVKILSKGVNHAGAKGVELRLKVRRVWRYLHCMVLVCKRVIRPTLFIAVAQSKATTSVTPTAIPILTVASATAFVDTALAPASSARLARTAWVDCGADCANEFASIAFIHEIIGIICKVLGTCNALDVAVAVSCVCICMAWWVRVSMAWRGVAWRGVAWLCVVGVHLCAWCVGVV
jgi:hypothetical protein